MDQLMGHVPLYPLAPALALGLATAALIAMIWFNPVIFAVFFAIMSVLGASATLGRKA